MLKPRAEKWLVRAIRSFLLFFVMFAIGKNLHEFWGFQFAANLAIVGYFGMFIPFVCALIGSYYERRGE